MRPAKIVAIVIGALLIIISLVLLVPGSLILWLSAAHHESDGYYTTSDRTLTSAGYALATPDLHLDIASVDWIPGGGWAQIRAQSSGQGPIFVGIGPTAQVNAYLSGVAYDEVTDLGWWGTSADYQHHDGGPPPSPPGQQTFWVAKQEGGGQQTLRWQVQGGTWSAVVMNADGTAPVNATVSLGARLTFLLPLGIGMTAGGVVLLAVGILLVVLGARRSRPPVQPAYPQHAGVPPYPGGPQYPGGPYAVDARPGPYQPAYPPPQPTPPPQPAPLPQPPHAPPPAPPEVPATPPEAPAAPEPTPGPTQPADGPGDSPPPA